MDEDVVWYEKPDPDRKAFPGEMMFIRAEFYFELLNHVVKISKRIGMPDEEIEKFEREMKPWEKTR